MKIKIEGVIKNLKGEPLKEGKRVGDKVEDIDLTYFSAITSALFSVSNDKTVPSKEKYKCYKLAMKLEEGKETNLSSEEITTIKDSFDNIPWSPLVVGRVFDLLEQVPQKEESKNAVQKQSPAGEVSPAP